MAKIIGFAILLILSFGCGREGVDSHALKQGDAEQALTAKRGYDVTSATQDDREAMTLVQETFVRKIDGGLLIDPALRMRLAAKEARRSVWSYGLYFDTQVTIAKNNCAKWRDAVALLVALIEARFVDNSSRAVVLRTLQKADKDLRNVQARLVSVKALRKHAGNRREIIDLLDVQDVDRAMKAVLAIYRDTGF